MNDATAKYYKRYRSLYERLTKKFRPKVEKALREQIKIFTDAWSEAQYITPAIIPPEIIEKSLKEVHITGGVNGAKLAKSSIKAQIKSTEVERWTWVINEYLRTNGLLNLSIEITNTLRKQIIKVLQKSVEEGWGIEETVRQLNTAKFPKWMATRIVRTELAKATNTGAYVGAMDAGIELEKMWISATDSRTRFIPRNKYDHLHMDGKIVGMDDGFVVPSLENVESLLYPGDPKGSAGNLINCRCTVAFVPVRDGEGKPIAMKPKNTNPFWVLLQQASMLGTSIFNALSNIFKEYEQEIEIK